MITRTGPISRTAWLLTLLPLAACRPAVEPQPARAEGAFAFLVGGDTTVVDEYVRTPTRLSGTVRILSREPGGATARATYRVFFTADGRADSAHLSVAQVSPSGVVEQEGREWSASLREDGSVAEVETPGGRRLQQTAGPDAVPLFGPSIATLESVLMRARATSAERIPVFHLAAAARVDTATLTWFGPDSVRLTLAGATGSYRVDEAGRILGGRAESEDLRTVRIR